jgi:transcriptional regulator with XRE-family HTH domain/tetratricopeptide (TPR) repeat protein
MSNNLATLRAKHNFSRPQLADLVGVTTLTLGRWERGEAIPRKYSRDKLCEVLECNEEALGFPKERVSLVVTDTPQDLTAPLYDIAIPFAPTHPLVGREHYLTRIKAAFRETKSSVVLPALNGLPGVGKTSLAITLVHDPEIRAYFGGGILWAGLGPTPNLAGLLSRWAGLFGMSETQFAEFDEDQKRQALRTAIGTRSMLLVLDDVWKLEDALALQVGSHNCAYLITTRFPAIATHLAVGNAMMIEELNEEQSMHLLRVLAPEVVDREETKVRELVHAVGGLPLALTLLGNYLRKQAYHLSARRTAAALERLSNVNERFKISEPHLRSGTHPSLPSSVAISLASIIEVSDHFLTATARETLYALSVFPPKPESFSEEAALSVAACTTDELDELVDAGLLEYQGADRYRLHRTIANYARLHLWEQTEEIVMLRLLVYMRQYVKDHAKEYELLEQEITLILYTLDRAVTGDAFQSQVVPFVCVAAPFLLMRGYYQETQHFLDRAYELATASYESVDAATVLLLLGEINQKRGDLSHAAALVQLTIVLRLQGHLPEAEARIQEAFSLIKEIGNRRYMCIVQDEIGNLALARGNMEQALEAFQEMLRLCPHDDSEVQAMSMFGLACTYEQLEQWDQALSFGQQSLELLQQKKLMQRIERVQTWYTGLVQRLSNRSLSVESCICGTPLVRTSGSGRTRRYCSDRCRKRAQRERETSGNITK